MSGPGYVWVDEPRALERAAADLTGASRLYLDSEFESNREGTRLCLLQVTAGSAIYLVDTLRLQEPGPLRAIFEAPEVEWVLHAGQQDVELFASRWGIRVPKKLFDTQVAWALLSAEANVSLAYLSFRLLGLRSDKAHQADDWVRRPLPESQLRYAASDVLHLPELARKLEEQAQAHDRLSIIHQASHEVLRPVREPTPPLRLESFRNAWQLGARSQAGLLHLIGWYNALSADEKRDAPEIKTLLSIASRLPQNPDELGRIKGVPRGFVLRHGKRLTRELSEAAARANTADFQPIDPPPYATFEDVRLEAWLGLLRAEVSQELQVSPEFVFPSRIQRELKAHVREHGTAGLEAAVSGYRSELWTHAVRAFYQRYPAPR